jgi:hypothetical protein
MKMRTYLICFIAAASSVCRAQDCESVIALSKVVSTVVSDRESVEQHAARFCGEYSRGSAEGDETRFGASYKFLAGTLGVANASLDAVASRYCSAANESVAIKDAYKQYVESISPNAYGAYEQCLQMSKRDLKFNVNLNSILPTEFSISASFVSSTGQANAVVTYVSSKDVVCRWDGGDGEVREIMSGSSAILECERPDPRTASYVSVVRKNGAGQELLTLPWPRYDESGVAVDSLAALSGKITALQSKMQEIDVAAGRSDVQAGTILLRTAGTREILDSTQCPSDMDTFRGEPQGRVNFPRPFASIPIVTVGLSSLELRGDDGVSRLKISVHSADQQGFNYSFVTWCRTAVYSASVSWLAIAH